MAGLNEIGLGCRLLSNMAAGAFFGAGIYIIFVECPARRLMPTAKQMLDNWQETFVRAKNMCSKIALLSTVSGLVGWSTDSDPSRWLTLISSGLMFSVLPWTIVFIAPVNSSLLDVEGAVKKGDNWIVERIDKWCRVHSMRVVFSAGAMLCHGLYWANKVNKFL